MKGVICSGAVIHDTLVRPAESPQWGTTTIVETIEAHVGGNAANTSIALATLGVPVRVVAYVGRDDRGRGRPALRPSREAVGLLRSNVVAEREGAVDRDDGDAWGGV